MYTNYLMQGFSIFYMPQTHTWSSSSEGPPSSYLKDSYIFYKDPIMIYEDQISIK